MWALRPQYENKGSNKLFRDLGDQINCVAAYLCSDGVFVIALYLSTCELAQPFAFLIFVMKTEILLLEKGVFQVKCFFVSVLYKGKGTITWSWLGHFQPSSLSLVYLLTSWEPWSQLAQGGRGDQRVVNLALFGDKGCTWNCGNSGNFKENQYKFGSRIII